MAILKLMGIRGVWAANPVTDRIVFILTFIMVVKQYKKLRQIGESKRKIIGYSREII